MMENNNKLQNALVIGLAQFQSEVELAISRSTINMNFIGIDKVNGCHSNGCVSLPNSLEVLEKLVDKNSIDVILGIYDAPSLLHGTLVHKYPDRFKGPSFTSVFLSYNKFFTRAFLDPDPIPYCYIDTSKPQTKEQLEKAIQTVGLPAIMKPSGGDFCSSIKKITSLEDLSGFADDMRKNYRASTSDCNEFAAKYLTEETFAVQDYNEGFILEQFVETPFKVSADGYVCNKEIVHWTIGDNCYWASHPECYKMTVIPSKLSEEIQEKIWKMYDQIAKRLIHYGYNNAFLNQEFFVREDGCVKLMEVNPRPTMALCKAYCKVLENGNFIETCLKITDGIRPKDPHFEGIFLCNFAFFSMISGKAEDIVNFDVLNSEPDVYSKGYHKGDYINPTGDAGSCVIAGALVAHSREELLAKYQSLFYRLFKVNPMGHCY